MTDDVRLPPPYHRTRRDIIVLELRSEQRHREMIEQRRRDGETLLQFGFQYGQVLLDSANVNAQSLGNILASESMHAYNHHHELVPGGQRHAR